MPKVSFIRRVSVQVFNWEYWPFSVLYFPVFFYFAWLALRAKSVFFFTASNPSIDFGGMFGEKKSDIFSIIPDKYYPKTKLIACGEVEAAMKAANTIGYPIIAKPDVGERGIWVKKIDGDAEMHSYATDCPVNFLLQEMISYPVELGVFYVKPPHGNDAGRVTSIVRKEFLEVIGDGQSSIEELLRGNPRAVLTADFDSEFLRRDGAKVLDKGERELIEPIGNHCRGTKFLDDQKEIDQRLTDAIDKIANEIPDFHFGRFDLKCQSIEDLRELKNFSILELNGAGAEPGHIYQPGYSLFKAYKTIFWHLRVLADISIFNNRRGIPYWSFKRGVEKWKSHRKHNRLLYRP